MNRNNIACIFFFFASFTSFATDYHFQEGFASSSPSGWTRQCSSTSTINHTGLTFSGMYAVKFDPAGSGRYGKNLISPEVTGADTLSFYVSKNANATYMTLYIGKVKGTDTTIIKTYDAFTFPNKSTATPFNKISIPIKDSLSTFKVIMYATVSTDPNYVNAGWFVVDDIELSKFTSTVPVVPPTSVEKIATNFGDGSWGTAVTTAYASGTYPSSSINGFILTKAFLLSGSVSCGSGETHTNRILLGKNTELATLEFPTLKTIGELEIHAATGTDIMSFRLEEWSGNQWQSLGTFTTRKSPDSIYVIPVVRNSETKLRIANNTGSGLYVYKLVSRTLQETLDLTLRSSSPTENEICFSNLKKSITLTFNKNIQKGTGTILLNGVAIPLDNCTFSGPTVTIPVTLTTQTGTNKNYTLSVSAGTFAEAGNSGNLSKTVTVNFQTIKSVLYPSNYTGLIDVVYKNVNSTNCRMDVYYPTNASNPVPVVINMHGGGWVSGAKEEQGGFDMYFNKGYAVVNVEYRMRNEILAPAAVEDVRGAMHYTLNHAQEWNIDKNKIIFQGGSAGGHLALMGGYLQNDRIYDNDCTQFAGEIKVMAVIDKYGAADLVTFTPVYSGMQIWLGTRASDDVFVKSLSPFHLVTAQTPPTYIIHGDADPTIPYNQSVELDGALQTAGVKHKFTTVPGGGHGGFTTAYNNQFETEVIQFLTEVLALQTTEVSKTNSNSIKMHLSGTKLVIDAVESTNTSLCDILGRKILQTNEKTIKIAQKGLYIVKVKTPLSEETFKINIR